MPVDPGDGGADEGVGGIADSIPVPFGASALAAGDAAGACEAAGAAEARGVDCGAEVGSSP